MNMKRFNVPLCCGKCKHIGRYTEGPYVRSPHYCCELMWQLYDEDYRVNPEKLDSKCPLKSLAVVKE